MGSCLPGGLGVINTLDLHETILDVRFYAVDIGHSAGNIYTWCLGLCCAFRAGSSGDDPYETKRTASVSSFHAYTSFFLLITNAFHRCRSSKPRVWG